MKTENGWEAAPWRLHACLGKSHECFDRVCLWIVSLHCTKLDHSDSVLVDVCAKDSGFIHKDVLST